MDLCFTKTSFWVQVHNIPIQYMNMVVAEKICEILGEVIQSPKDATAQVGNFIWVRVSMDITIPLTRGRLVSLKKGKQVWVQFKYEHLPNICYWCGCFDCDDKDCNVWIEIEGSLTPD